jgi:hypothetical protein
MSGARWATPDQRTVQLTRAGALFNATDCASAFTDGNPDLSACRTAYCGGTGCGDDALAVAAMLSRALEQDHGVPASCAANRFVAASLVVRFMPRVEGFSGDRVVFELGPATDDDVTAVLIVRGSAGERTLPLSTDAERAAALTALPSPLAIEPRAYAFEHVAVLAALVARGSSFVFVAE